MGGVYQGVKLPTPTTEVYHKLWVVYQEDVREEKQRGFFYTVMDATRCTLMGILEFKVY